MAKNSTGKSDAKGKAKGGKKTTTSIARVSSANGGGRSESQDGFDARDAFTKLLQSPLAAELVAVAATAALAALAEHGFTSGGGGSSRGKRAGKAVKEAGKAAAAAVGRRLGNELDEIRKAATKGGAEA